MTEQVSPAAAESDNAAEPASELAALRQQLTEAQAKAAANWDQYLRARADADNIRKRAERDVSHAHKFALEGIAGELLGICDSLELGLAAAEQPGTDVAKLGEGLKLTQQQLIRAMERYGIQAISPQGQVFNPDQHQAISMQESAEQPANTVLQVLQKGYTLRERLLRPAIVIVAKAPAQAADPEQQAQEGQDVVQT
ncbi:MAG: nucleotide exchange factor GrpE [Nevskiales bacterium]